MIGNLKSLLIGSLRGGLNSTDPATFLPEDQGPVSQNLDFFEATIGASRRGAVRISPPAASGIITTLYQYLPTNNLAESILFMVLNNAGTIAAWFKDPGWTALTLPDASIGATLGNRPMGTQTLHGRLFMGYPSAVDRLHVKIPGTTTRRTGLAAPVAPGVADAGAGFYPAVLRYYRQRYTTQSGGVTIRRSEPSPSVSFTPSGLGTSATITKAAAIGESETHWEIEASTDNVLFYRIATLAVGIPTYADTSLVATYSSNPLSEDIGDYSLQWSAKFMVADEDRLLIAGAWDDVEKMSRVGWTPVRQAPGVGNDERLELDTDPVLDLDGFEGGEITGMSQALNGYIHVFKRSHVYRLVRTGSRARAYEAIPLSKSRGALPGSLASAFDENGNPAQYFWDPTLGPQRVGSEGIQDCGRDIRTLVTRVNVDAEVPACALYVPDKDQVWFWVALDGATAPTVKLVFQIRDGRTVGDGVRKGWTLHTMPDYGSLGNSTYGVRDAAMYADNVETTTAARSTRLLPLVGTGAIATGLLQAERGNTDNGYTFESIGETRPQVASGLLRRVGVMSGTVVGRPGIHQGLRLTAIRDYGIEEKTVDVDLSPVGAEVRRIVPLDNFTLSELRSIAFRFASRDPADFLVTGAMGFNGSTAYARRAYSSSVVDDFSLGGWVYATADGVGLYPFYIGSSVNGYGIRLVSGFWLGVYLGINVFGGTSAPLALNTWVHLAIRRRAGTSQLFLNGLPVGATLATAPLAPTTWMTVGGLNGGALFPGRVAHFFLTHQALTNDQLLALATNVPTAPLAPYLLSGGLDFVDQDPFFDVYPLQSATDLSDATGAHTLTAANVTTAVGPTVTTAPAPWAVDILAAQIRQEESQ